MVAKKKEGRERCLLFVFSLTDNNNSINNNNMRPTTARNAQQRALALAFAAQDQQATAPSPASTLTTSTVTLARGTLGAIHFIRRIINPTLWACSQSALGELCRARQRAGGRPSYPNNNNLPGWFKPACTFNDTSASSLIPTFAFINLYAGLRCSSCDIAVLDAKMPVGRGGKRCSKPK